MARIENPSPLRTFATLVVAAAQLPWSGHSIHRRQAAPRHANLDILSRHMIWYSPRTLAES